MLFLFFWKKTFFRNFLSVTCQLSLFLYIWKIKLKEGNSAISGDHVKLVLMEAVKTFSKKFFFFFLKKNFFQKFYVCGVSTLPLVVHLKNKMEIGGQCHIGWQRKASFNDGLSVNFGWSNGLHAGAEPSLTRRHI